MTKTHIIKCAPEYWDALADGSKTFELRFNDRGYAVGDVLEIHKFDDVVEQPAPLIMRVTYVLPGGLSFGGRVLLDPSAVIMGIKPALAQDQDAKADKLMIEHLRDTLIDIRDKVKAGEQMLRDDLVALIDEALDA